MLRDLRLAARMMWQAKAVLDSLSRNQRPLLCDISHWEVATLVERGRLELDLPLGEWLDAAALGANRVNHTQDRRRRGEPARQLSH